MAGVDSGETRTPPDILELMFLTMCIIRRDKMCTSAYWCGSCPIRRRTRRIHLFVADSRPAPFSCRDKTVRTQRMQEAAYSRDSQQKWKLLSFETPQIVGHPNIPQTPYMDTHLTVHMPQYKVLLKLAVVGLALCGHWAK